MKNSTCLGFPLNSLLDQIQITFTFKLQIHKRNFLKIAKCYRRTI